MKKIFENKLNSIFLTLKKNEEKTSKIGVKWGQLGYAIFYFSYAKYFQDKEAKERAISVYEEVIEKILEGNIEGRKADEFSSFGCFTAFFNNNNMLNYDVEPLLLELDEYMAFNMKTCMSEGDYDIIGGALSPAYYFLNRKNNTTFSNENLNQLALWILEISTTEKNTKNRYWNSVMFPEKRVYLGIAHGNGSIIVFLEKLYKKNIQKALCKQVIEEAANFIMSKYHVHKKSCFPVAIGFPIVRGPLEWCYGDLGTAYALHKAGVFLANEKMKSMALDVFDFCEKRIYEEDVVKDAGLVHGAMGMAIMFQKIFQITAAPKYEQAVQKSIALAFSYEDNKHPYAGFSSYYQLDQPGSDTGFLSGIAGIGTALINLISKDTSISDEFLYL